METRQVTQVKIWFLLLNPMTDRAEYLRVGIWGTDKENLIEFYKSQITTPYTNSGFYKNFIQGGPLEWFNPLYGNIEDKSMFGHGLESQWLNEEELESIQAFRVW